MIPPFSRSLFIRLLFCLFPFCFPLIPALHAQGAAETATAAAVEVFNQGNYDEAAKAFEEVLQNYPTSPQVPEAQMRAGYAHLLAGNYEKAEEFLRKILEPPAPETVQEIGYSLLPQAMAAGAAAMDAESPNRKSAFEKAIVQYGVYLEKFPRNEEAENALYGRALSSYQIQNYDDTIKDLRLNLATFPRSQTILDSQYLLALTLATQANDAMQEKKDAATANPLYDEAEKLLLDIYTKKADIALANDAIFQVAEIRFNRAALNPDDAARRTLMLSALEAYRLTQAKDKMIEAQEQKLKEIQDARVPALRSGNQDQVRRVQRFFERESSKMEQLRKKEDQTVAANMKSAQIYYQLGDYDATRVLMRYNQKFVSSEDDQRTALYHITMTYALQGVIDKALELYDEFQSKHKGHAIASNLPLAIGTMLNTVGRAEEATKYLAEQSELYPGGSFAEIAIVQQANAYVGLGRFDEALKTYQDYLANNKDAPESVTVQAELGIANVYKDTARWDEAIAQYRKVIQQFSGMEDTVELASFWVAYGLLQKGDAPAATQELTAFLAKYPNNKELGSPAMFSLAQAQLAGGDSGAALETFKRTADTFPGTEPASFAYFQRAQLFASNQRTDDVISEMNAFIENYPEDTKVFAAHDTIGQNQLALGNIDEAISAYTRYVEKYPDSGETAQALLKLSDLRRSSTTALGRYVALPEETREQWNTSLGNSIAAAEQILEKFPDSPVVALALQSLLEAQRLLVGSQQKTAADLEKYFEDFAAKFDSNPATRSKVLFTLASHLYATDAERALTLMSEAYKPDIILAPADLDLYGMALIEKKQLDEAKAIYEKMAGDYPIPPGTDPQQAPAQIQEAQATVLYAQGRILQESGDVTEAGKLFDRLKTLYPWSPKILEANYGIAAAQFAEGKHGEALSMVSAIIRAQTATVELRAKSMLLGGFIQKKDYETATDPKEKTELLEAAIDYFIKIASFYEGVPKYAAEGLWEGAKLLEIQVAGITDAAKKKIQLGKALRAYQDLIAKFPESPNIEEAKSRLSALGAAR